MRPDGPVSPDRPAPAGRGPGGWIRTIWRRIARSAERLIEPVLQTWAVAGRRGLVSFVMSMGVLGVVACGPGVGGTGTGPSATAGAVGLASFGALAQPVCAGALAQAIGCTAGTTGGVSTPPTLRRFTGECAVATFEADELVLDLVCPGPIAYFAGRWGVGPDQVGRFYGQVGADALVPPTEPARVDVEVDGDALVFWLRGLDGQLLAGPLTLR